MRVYIPDQFDSDYEKILNISFSPETDITGNRTPINELVAEIQTEDDIEVGQYLCLYDDVNTLFAKFWITYADRIREDVVKITASDNLKLLERDMKDPVMYSSENVTDVLDDIFYSMGGSSAYELDSGLVSKTISGFCPNQSAKTRLQWVCFSINAYVKSTFVDKIQIKEISQSHTLIPIDKTYWKPSVKYSDYVTAVKIVAYSFTQGTPSTTDKWVSDGTNTYIVSRQTFTLSNPYAPPSALVHEILFEDIMLINSANVSAMLTFFSTYYFKRASVEIDVINNGEYHPGDAVTVYTDVDKMAAGYIDSASFTFGTQAKSRLKITPVEEVDCEKLIVVCIFPGEAAFPSTRLDRREYSFPVGYQYSVENIYYDVTYEKRRYVFRPLTETVTGTMPDHTVWVVVKYAVALRLYANILTITSVDEAEQSGEAVTIT